ncbi:hypothetical protein [Vallitalea guaymasensis]|uniref:hypothetical protein n=1 Tax=Vallitalea guaymasensis TaxID=1185412 RepID=UPI000DE2AC17|nr:hypothetical protein [Vallitalea guaymasensis]
MDIAYMEDILKSEDKLPPKLFISDNIYIRTKKRTVIKLVFNPIQDKYWESKENRDIILKPRQLGFSTLILAEFFEATINNSNINTVIIAHTEDATRKLFNALQFMYKNLDDATKIRINGGSIEPKYGNRKEYYFEAINSRITIGTAGSTDFGRGDTINYAHCSEVAFWKNAEEIMTGLLQAVPRDGRVVIESTANGVGNYFYNTYFGAKKDNNSWTAHFYRWFDHPEYVIALDKGEVLELDKEEKELVKKYNLSMEQIKWRRWKIDEMPDSKGVNKEDRFKQEYPEDDMSCFINSGRPVFNVKRLYIVRRKLETHKNYREYIISEESEPEKAVIREDSGELKVFKKPDPNRFYVLGGDVAEGKENGDFSCGQVLDWQTAEQVAELHGHWDTDIYAKKLARLGWWYNYALLGVERNNHGHSVLNVLLNYENYLNLYHHVKYNADQEEEAVPGYPTDKQTKPIMVTDGQQAVREGWAKINSIELTDELITYIRLKGGKLGAQNGCFDDRVMGWLIALQLRKAFVIPFDAEIENSEYGGSFTTQLI